MKKHRIEAVYKNLPSLETERLLLRPLRPSDAEDLYEFASRPCVSEYLLWDPHRSLSYTKEYLADILKMYRRFEYFEWAVVERQSNKMIGTCGFTAFDFRRDAGEIGYSLNPDYWGRGYATEAAAAALRFGFETLELERVEAFYVLDNTASARVLAHIGMKYMGETEPMCIKEHERRVGIYALTREEYSAVFSGKENLLVNKI